MVHGAFKLNKNNESCRADTHASTNPTTTTTTTNDDDNDNRNNNLPHAFFVIGSSGRTETAAITGPMEGIFF